MKYINLLQLINLCVEEKILKTHEENILVYRNKGEKSKEGWYMVTKEYLAMELKTDSKGVSALLEALKNKGITFVPNIPENDWEV